MLKIGLVFMGSLLSLIFNCYGQSNYMSSGYVSLIIKGASLHDLKNLEVDGPFMSDPLQGDRPVTFRSVNDSTLLLSEFTFGPASVFFRINGRYLSTILLPNETNFINLHVTGSANLDLDYHGSYKEIFDNSDLQEKLIMKMFSYMPTVKKGGAKFTSEKELTEVKMLHLNQMKDSLLKNVPSQFLRNYYSKLIETFQITPLLKDYRTSLLTYYKMTGIDDKKEVNIPVRTRSYYENLITSSYLDSLSLLPSGYFDLLLTIQKDTLLQLPDILKAGPAVFIKSLKKTFKYLSQDDHNLFYDMMAASAYINAINQGQQLSDQNLYDIVAYFKNKQLSSYILHRFDISVFSQKNGEVFFLPFEKENDDVLNNILEKYKGKAVLIDLWATWCGPCLAASPAMEKVKKRFENRNDIKFIYLTDETSDRNRFYELTKVLKGEHYYLHKNQFEAIKKKYNFEGIPSYVVFDKNGNMSQASTAPDNLEEVAKAWIEKVL
ncbi:TlpA family protein disulfide reductase [Sphingobacterium sp.]|uniref:TlpA family protein disulfide reductase n=1 Tax=Sphingobacterium sp. TaxID=341027 RepID=UPI002FDDE145